MKPTPEWPFGSEGAFGQVASLEFRIMSSPVQSWTCLEFGLHLYQTSSVLKDGACT